MKSLALALLLSPATAAILRPRQGSSGCCFQLASVGVVNKTVTEDHVGELLLGGAFQQGGFCLDRSTKTIKDGLNHNCFMRSPVHQFECYAGIVGATAFDISPPKEDGKYYLTYDGGPGVFYACPVGSGANAYSDIYSSEKADKSGCVPISLALSMETPECSSDHDISGSSSSTSTAVSQQTPVVRRSSQVIRAEPTPTMTRTVVLPAYFQSSRAESSSSSVPTAVKAPQAPAEEPAALSPVCSVSPSSPSIAPIRIGCPDPSSPDGIKDTSGEASISSTNSTILQYTIPNAFLPPRVGADAGGSLCALQFRMPVCTTLPEGYPCYKFSGLEQEMLANSGMTFNLTLDDGDATWDGASLHQVFPGDNTILGTFECGSEGKGGHGGRKMQWFVSSVREFGLEFFHAGVGESPQYEDGIGAWIVPCS